MISIEGLDKADVLATLYNGSKPQGMGFLHYDPASMTKEEAEKFLEETEYNGRIYFDYLMGRVMKVELSSDVEFDPRLYDRDNGSGSAEFLVSKLREESK